MQETVRVGLILALIILAMFVLGWLIVLFS